MANWTHFYLIRIEFLGFRYHGWQKQDKLKSVHGMIDKTFDFILQHSNYRSLGCGRTDAKVSADDYALELFCKEEMDTEQLLAKLNLNLPSDIRVKTVQNVNADFNIIQHVRCKEYHYYFSFGEKSHPFNAPFIRHFTKPFDMDKMKEAARIFEGKHNFKRFTSKPTEHTILEREILSSDIVSNTKLTGSFFPDNTFVFKVKAAGFLRYQVRLMMGALLDVGSGSLSIDGLKEALSYYEGEQIKHIAPSSGLVLHKVEFEKL